MTTHSSGLLLRFSARQDHFPPPDITGRTSAHAWFYNRFHSSDAAPCGKNGDCRPTPLIAPTYFDKCFQFNRRCIGSVDNSCNSVRTRKRPSRVTSYCCLSGTRVIWVWNSVTGVPELRSPPVTITFAAISFRSGATKYNSLPSARHRGEFPPLDEICRSRPGPGNGRT